MIDPATLFLGLALHVQGGKAYDRPRYDSAFNCSLALMLAKPELQKHSLDPKRFACVPEGDKFIIRGKLRGEP